MHIYVIFNKNSEALYVGKSSNIYLRSASHNNSKYNKEACFMDAIYIPDKFDLSYMEKVAIKLFKPKYNIQDKNYFKRKSYDENYATYLKYGEWIYIKKFHGATKSDVLKARANTYKNSCKEYNENKHYNLSEATIVTMNNNSDELYTTGQTAKMLNISMATLYNWERNGKLRPAYINPNTKRKYYTFNQITQFLGW